MAGEPGALVLTIFDQLINRIKSTRPIRTDGKALTTGFVYSQLVLGMPIDPRDFRNPWSPMGGSTLQQAAAAAGATVTQGTPAPPPAAGAATTPPAGGAAGAGGAAHPPPIDPSFRKAMEAAFKTSELVDRAIMVTKDDSFLEYPTTRHISFAYDGIINGMQPLPMPAIDPAVQKQIDDSMKVLYKLDTDGSVLGKSPLYANYVKNATAFAKAKKDMSDAQTRELGDPATADNWPLDAVTFQNAVDQAFNDLKTEGGDKIERALDIIGSVGVCMQDHMIKAARQVYDAWNLGITGVSQAIPLSFISPTSWCDPLIDDSGWEGLTVDQSSYNSNSGSSSSGHSEMHFTSDSSSASAGGTCFLGFCAIGGGGSTDSSDSTFNSNWSYQAQSNFHNDASGLSISLEYALCTIDRPWLIGDLFFMQNWYLIGNKKNAISDGSIDNQAKRPEPLMPMIPVQFLAIRNVKISATSWGDDGAHLESHYGDSAADSHSTESSGSAGISLGFVNFGGSESSSSSSSNSSGNSADSATDRFRSHFDGQTLTVNGTQIIAWLSEVVPACAPVDAPAPPQ